MENIIAKLEDAERLLSEVILDTTRTNDEESPLDIAREIVRETLELYRAGIDKWGDQ